MLVDDSCALVAAISDAVTSSCVLPIDLSGMGLEAPDSSDPLGIDQVVKLAAQRMLLLQMS